MIDVYFTTVRLHTVEQKDGKNSNDLLGNELFVNLPDLFSVLLPAAKEVAIR